MASLGRWLQTRWVILVGVWFIPGLIGTSQEYLLSSYRDLEVEMAPTIVLEFVPWMWWAVATPLILALRRRCPPSTAWGAGILVHVLANAAIATAQTWSTYSLGRLLEQEPFVSHAASEMILLMLIKGAFLQIFLYWGVIAADHGLEAQRRHREAALERARLEARLVEAQLDALKVQLHPHFLFNTLNAIAVLMRKGQSAGAIKMIGGLADLLRRSLSSLRLEFATLTDELDFLQRYVDIETTRFSDRLRVAIDVAPEVGQAKVPSLILQPIVENAIKHGLAPRASGGSIDIVARSIGDGTQLRIEVRDDGVGLGAGAEAGTGLGLAHVRKRLAQLYPGRHRFSLSAREPSGAIATLEIPLQLEGT